MRLFENVGMRDGEGESGDRSRVAAVVCGVFGLVHGREFAAQGAGAEVSAAAFDAGLVALRSEFRRSSGRMGGGAFRGDFAF